MFINSDNRDITFGCISGIPLKLFSDHRRGRKLCLWRGTSSMNSMVLTGTAESHLSPGGLSKASFADMKAKSHS